MAADKELHRRIEALNGAPLENVPREDAEIRSLRRKIAQKRPETASDAAGSAIVYRRNLPASHTPRSIPAAPTLGAAVTLTQAVRGDVTLHASRGPAYASVWNAEDLGNRAHRVVAGLPACLGRPESDLITRSAELCEMERLEPADLVFLDLETCGLTSAPLFLGGLLRWEQDGPVVQQYLARDYSEEAAVTAFVAGLLCQHKLLVTFNGKTFDLPFLKMRAAANAVAMGEDLAHLDMLHECRRAWRHRLPDCKLQTLERYVCGWYRTDDIPGSEVPEAYHEFVRTGDARDLARIMHHNRLDLLTLAELFIRLAESDAR